tara:strand:- start:711 stop:1325 length:615 start_codon:yes stop_codon:yes gene_type:complete
MTTFDFIDIGTADFEYSTLDPDCKDCLGLYVEPIKKYLDRIPENSNTLKLAAAITDEDKDDYIYYIDPDLVEQYNLPAWIKGCNTISKIHPTTISTCLGLGVKVYDIVTREPIKCISLKRLFEDLDIHSVKRMKIDTEGSDCGIVRQAIDLVNNTNIVIQEVTFETNELTPHQEIFSTFDLLERNGWVAVEKGYNSTFRLKERK